MTVNHQFQSRLLLQTRLNWDCVWFWELKPKWVILFSFSFSFLRRRRRRRRTRPETRFQIPFIYVWNQNPPNQDSSKFLFRTWGSSKRVHNPPTLVYSILAHSCNWIVTCISWLSYDTQLGLACDSSWVRILNWDLLSVWVEWGLLDTC